MGFLTPPPFKPERTGAEADKDYKRLRWQVFIGIFIGYAGFYIVRKNFSKPNSPRNGIAIEKFLRTM